MSNFPRDYKDRPEFTLSGPYTAFHEVATSHRTPIIQLDPLYGLRVGIDTEQFSANGGTATVFATSTGREFYCRSGNANIGGYGIVRSKYALRYRAGVGQLIKMTARFGAPQTLTGMRVGGINSGNEMSFGYNGTTFGIYKKSGGKLEMRNLQFTTAPNATQTATILLNGSTFTAQIDTNGVTLAASDLALTTFTGWALYANNDTVLFQNEAVGPNAGEFSFTTTGNAVAVFSSLASGATATETWTYQSDWNRDRMDGSNDPTYNRSKKTLDPSKGNIYGIQYQYLGYGFQKFYVDSPSEGPILVHVMENVNSIETPNIENPILKLGWTAFNAGNAGDVSIYGGSGFGGYEGDDNLNLRNPRGVSASKNIGASFTPILSIRNRREYDANINLTDTVLNDAEVAVDGTKVAEIAVYLNPTLVDPSFQYISQTLSSIEVDTAATAMSNGIEIFAASLGKTGSWSKALREFGVKLAPTDVITIAGRTTGGTSDFSASLTWTEI